MKINITLDVNPTDFRALRGILIAAVLALHPSAQPALEDLKHAVEAQVLTWSPPLGAPEVRAKSIMLGDIR